MRSSRGVRRASSLATQRRLHLVRQLIRGPATAAELITALQLRMGAHIYPAKAHEALRHDIEAVREIFACKIVYQGNEGYVLTALGHLTLLDLPEDELTALAQMLAAIREGVISHTEVADRLSGHLRILLPEELRQILHALETAPADQ